MDNMRTFAWESPLHVAFIFSNCEGMFLYLWTNVGYSNKSFRRHGSGSAGHPMHHKVHFSKSLKNEVAPSVRARVMKIHDSIHNSKAVVWCFDVGRHEWSSAEDGYSSKVNKLTGWTKLGEGKMSEAVVTVRFSLETKNSRGVEVFLILFFGLQTLLIKKKRVAPCIFHCTCVIYVKMSQILCCRPCTICDGR